MRQHKDNAKHPAKSHLAPAAHAHARHSLKTSWSYVLIGTLALAAIWLPLALAYGNPSAVAPAAGVKAAQAPPVIGLNNLTHGNNPAAYVAHALGEIDGHIYTNSLDAFNLNYSRGYRMFECDLVSLKDGTVFLAHDGHESLYGLSKPFSETTKADIAHAKENGKYTPLTSEGLIKLARGHPDARFILDTKNHDIDIIRTLVAEADGDQNLLNRLIPNVWNQSYYDQVMQAHHFEYTMLALYRTLALDPATTEDEVISLIKRNHITAIAMHEESDPTMTTLQTGDDPAAEPFSLQRFQAKLRAAGIPAYVHSIKNQADKARYRQLGMGVYMDIPLK